MKRSIIVSILVVAAGVSILFALIPRTTTYEAKAKKQVLEFPAGATMRDEQSGFWGTRDLTGGFYDKTIIGTTDECKNGVLIVDSNHYDNGRVFQFAGGFNPIIIGDYVYSYWHGIYRMPIKKSMQIARRYNYWDDTFLNITKTNKISEEIVSECEWYTIMKDRIYYLQERVMYSTDLNGLDEKEVARDLWVSELRICSDGNVIVAIEWQGGGKPWVITAIDENGKRTLAEFEDSSYPKGWAVPYKRWVYLQEYQPSIPGVFRISLDATAQENSSPECVFSTDQFEIMPSYAVKDDTIYMLTGDNSIYAAQIPNGEPKFLYKNEYIYGRIYIFGDKIYFITQEENQGMMYSLTLDGKVLELVAKRW